MDFASDENGDIDLKDNDFYFVTGVDATVQFLKQRFKLFLGEWPLDESLGVPYFDEIFIKNPNPVTLDFIFKTLILESPGVLQLTSYDLQLNGATRAGTLTISIIALDGEADFSIPVFVPGG